MVCDSSGVVAEGFVEKPSSQQVVAEDVARLDSDTTRLLIPEDDNARAAEPQLLSQSTTKRLTAHQKRGLLFMSIASIFVYIMFSVISPFFPGEAILKDISVTEIGIIFASYELTQILFSVICGKIIKHVDCKFLFVSGMVIRSTSDMLFSIVLGSPDGKPFFWVCFAIRGVEGIGAAMFLCASYTMVIREYPTHISFVFGILQTFNSIGLMAGPPIGGVLYELGGFELPFIVIGCCTLVVGVVGIFALPNDPVKPNTSSDFIEKSSGGVYSKLFSIPMFWLHVITIGVSWFPYNFYYPLLEIHMTQLQLSPVIVGLVFVCQPLSYALASLILGKINHKFEISPVYTEVAGYIVTTIALLCIGPSPFIYDHPMLVMIIVGMVLTGVGGALMVMPGFSSMLKEAKNNGLPDNTDTYGLVAGVFSSSWGIGALSGPLLGSPISEHIGFELACTWVAVFVAVVGAMILTAYIILRFRARHKTKFEALANTGATPEEGTSLVGDCKKFKYYTYDELPESSLSSSVRSHRASTRYISVSGV